MLDSYLELNLFYHRKFSVPCANIELLIISKLFFIVVWTTAKENFLKNSKIIIFVWEKKPIEKS